MLDEREKEIMECLVHGWLKDPSLYGGLSYQCVMDLLTKLGCPHLAKEVSDHIGNFQREMDEIAKKMGYK